MAAARPASSRFSTVSARKAPLSSAACAAVSGGTSRVFVVPGVQAFAMTATAQRDARAPAPKARSSRGSSAPGDGEGERRSDKHLSATEGRDAAPGRRRVPQKA